MVSLLMVTHVDFWKEGAGHRTRILSLVNYLRSKVKFTIVYAGYANDQDEQLLKIQYPDVQVTLLAKSERLTYKQYSPLFERYLAGKKFDVALVEYIEMSFILPFLEEGTFTLLDTHDLVSDRIQSFQSHGIYYDGIQLSKQDELNLFNCYDKVIAIQESDYKKIASALGEDRVLLIPHVVHFPQKTIAPHISRIGYIASGYAPNVQALAWFLDHVWTRVNERWSFSFEVFGPVCEAIPADSKLKAVNVNFHGFTPELNAIYEMCDVIINPVQCGAGLKIKNVEALGNGLPLITTSHGAIGLTEGEDCFIVSDTADEIIHAIDRLDSDFDFRKKIATNAFAYARTHFSANKGYEPLLSALLKRS